MTTTELEHVAESDQTALVVIPKTAALSMFSTDGGIDPLLAGIKSKIDAFSADVDTPAGRKEIRSFAFKIVRSKTYIESVARTLEEEQKKIPQRIAACRKEAAAMLDAWAEDVRKPLTDWETAEKARAAALKAALDDLRGVVAATLNQPATLIEDTLARVRAINPQAAVFGDEAALAAALQTKAVDGLTAALQAARERDSQAAELEALRRQLAERAEADRAAAAAKAAAEQAAAAEAARLAAEQAAVEAAERRKVELAEAAARAAAETEARMKREADEQAAAIAQEDARRAADVEHRAAINRTALAAFMAGGIAEDVARLAVKLIAGGKIPAVSIKY